MCTYICIYIYVLSYTWHHTEVAAKALADAKRRMALAKATAAQKPEAEKRIRSMRTPMKAPAEAMNVGSATKPSPSTATPEPKIARSDAMRTLYFEEGQGAGGLFSFAWSVCVCVSLCLVLSPSLSH